MEGSPGRIRDALAARIFLTHHHSDHISEPAEKLLAEEFGAVVMSHGKTMYDGARRRLREAISRCDYDVT